MSILGPKLSKLSHAGLLRILPFTTGYLCDEETGKPDSASVTLAMMLQAVEAAENPYLELKEYEN
jgi:hypothetical protein